MSDTRSRRQILRAGALAGGALVPSTLAAAADAPAAAGVTGRTALTGNDVRAARQPVVPASFAHPGGRGRGAQNR